MPDFALQTIDGGTFRLSEQRGRVVGVYVIASWCDTCIPGTRAWDRLAGEQGSRGLSVVAVSGDPADTPDDLRRFAALAKAERPIWALDPKGEFVRQFQVHSLDTTLIIDRAGQLVYRTSVPVSYDVLRRELDKVLQHVAIDFHELIATGVSAALDEAERRWGPGVFRVRGHTRRACCVHLTVERAGVEVDR